MTAPALTKQQVEDAAPLDFEAKRAAAQPARAYPIRSYAIDCVSPAGYRVTVTLNDIKLDVLEDALAGLLERGYLPADLAAPAANPTPAATAVPTCQNRNCSKYGEPMEPSQHGTGYYCKGKDPTTGNPKGYCKSTK